jgi:hypothetical protein
VIHTPSATTKIKITTMTIFEKKTSASDFDSDETAE